MSLDKLNELELKAAAYDRLALIEKCQREIQLINQELAKREINKGPEEKKK